MCDQCFKKSDHVEAGHRVRLERHISGSCDCGDPEDFDPKHFCSDHTQKSQRPQDLLNKIPKKILEKADVVFEEFCI